MPDRESEPAPGPQPGDVYREYALHNGGNRDWRVTDPEASAQGAQQFLPNPKLELTIDDLEHAIRAEALLDRWGGHLRTTNKRIRFNGNDWITLPELRTVPKPLRAEDVYSQDNVRVPIPLDHLREGVNALEGTCGALDDYNWGQWGLYSVIVRIYYDPARKGHPTGEITSPNEGETLGENPTIRVAPRSRQGVARVDVLAWYEGYDENGDGVFQDWHQAYFQPYRGGEAELREHVGTLWRAPYRCTWNTRWVPDQAPRSIKLLARIQDARGIWFVTKPVENLSLSRENESVRLFRSSDVPRGFGVRVGQQKSCTINIEDVNESGKPGEAILALRTWHGWDGHHHPLQLNEHSFKIDGKNHHYDYDLLPIPVEAIQSGKNTFTIRSDTEHHMLEVLWPGPALIVRYRK